MRYFVSFFILSFVYPIIVLSTSTTPGDSSNVNTISTSVDTDIHNKASNNNNRSTPHTNLNTLVTLDLTGKFDVHISSPSIIINDKTKTTTTKKEYQLLKEDYEYTTKPLFQWGTNYMNQFLQDKRSIKSIMVPHVHIGGHYNFQNVWYGLTRIITTLSWGKVNHNHNHNNNHSQGYSATMSVEKGLLPRVTPSGYYVKNNNEYALDVGLSFPIQQSLLMTFFQHRNSNIKQQQQQKQQYRHDQPSSISFRYETTDKNHNYQPTASLYAKTNFLHPRLQIIGKSIVRFGEGTNVSLKKSKDLSSSPFLSRIKQQAISLSDESSWIPDIKVTPGGKVISNSSFGLMPSNADRHRRIGFRMTIKKQINWNILGSIFHQQDALEGLGINSMSYVADDESANDTSIRLEVCGLTGVTSFTSLAVQGAVERIKDTFQCTLLQEGVLN